MHFTTSAAETYLEHGPTPDGECRACPVGTGYPCQHHDRAEAELAPLLDMPPQIRRPSPTQR
jgi:hypothetical protein